MAPLLPRPGQRRAGLALLAPLLCALSSVSALSVAPRLVGSGQRGLHSVSRAPSTATPTALFATSAARPLPDFLTPINGANESVDRPRNAASAALAKVAHLVRKIRRPLLHAAIVVSIVLIGLKNGLIPPAHAWGRAAEPVAVDAAARPSWGKKLTKLVVTGGAVAAGVVTANKVRCSSDGDGKGSGIEIKGNSASKVEGSSPPDPLSTEWIEQELKEAEAAKPKPTPAQPNLPNLDTKIEMLRAREELARATAEKQRQADLEKAAEVRKQGQSEIDAKIAAFEQQQRLEQERVERIRTERAERETREREAQLSKLERVKVDKKPEASQSKAETGPSGKTENVASSASAPGPNGDVNVEQARRQPKSPEEERKLQEKYGGMDLEERAFNILADLKMIELHEDPESAGLSDDDDEEGAFM